MKKIGIIGGMGPLATVDLFNKIVQNTNAAKDQDNIPILIDNNPQIPDRTNSILYDGKSPVPSIVKMGTQLEKMGADFLLMPCNTSHYYFDEITSHLSVPLLNMVDIVCQEITNQNYKNICILGTEGTIKTGVYHTKLDEQGIYNVPIDSEMIDILTFLIYKVVKSNNFSYDISKFINKMDELLKKHDIDAFVLGCTELPVLFERYHLNYKTLDPTDLLAKEAVRLAKE